MSPPSGKPSGSRPLMLHTYTRHFAAGHALLRQDILDRQATGLKP